jgi:S-DNA-T family DNA segregation ATPase FtsK/SpoIIIE
MNVVLRTSYGEAEISLRNTSDESTLADVLAHVTGQRSPPILFVDGRALPATTKLRASGMLNGSTIATGENEIPLEDGIVKLVQIAGRGGGESAVLAAGHYVLGIGRRASAPELDLAPVDHPSFELTIQDDGGVTIHARTSTIRVDGHQIAVGENVPWSTGTLDSGDRVFQLLRRGSFSRISGRRLHARPGQDTTAFNRPHRRPQARMDGPITLHDAAHSENSGRRSSAISTTWTETVSGRHGAERDRRRSAEPHLGDLLQLAHDADPRVWERRPGDADAFHVAVGLADMEWSPEVEATPEVRAKAEEIIEGCGPLPMVPVSIDFTTERGVAVVGRSNFRSDLARGLILEATLTHGPADFDVVVLTSLDYMPAWEWAKWLPHTRVDGTPLVLFDNTKIQRWVNSVHAGSEQDEEPTQQHLTLVVVDNSALWHERGSPLRPLFSDSSLPLRFIVLTDATEGAPAVCSTILTENLDLTVGAEYVGVGHHVYGIRPFLASVDIALSIALDLAPLDDPELPARTVDNSPTPLSYVDLRELEKLDANAFIDRWARADNHPNSRLGLPPLDPVAAEINDGPGELIVGDEASDLLRSVIIGLACEHAPDELQFALFDFTNGVVFDTCEDLPHTVWHESELDEHRADRVLRCLRAEVRRRVARVQLEQATEVTDDRQLHDGQLPRLILVVDEAASADTQVPNFLSELAGIARAGQQVGLQLIVATDRADNSINLTITAAPDLRVTVAESALDIRPFVIGRELSPMEHRLTRSKEPRAEFGAGPDPEVRPELAQIVATMSQAAETAGLADIFRPCPDPLPDTIPMQSFFDAHPGDGIPFALVDLPDEQRREPTWWRPGLGAGLLVFGGASSGKTSILVTLALGVAERFSADDVHLYCIDAGDRRLDPLARLPHTGTVTHADDPEGVTRLVQELGREIERRNAAADDTSGAQQAADTEPAIVVMVDDIANLRSTLEPQGAWSAFEQMLSKGHSVGLHSVITASGPDDLASSFTRGEANQVVLRLDDPSGYERFGVDPIDSRAAGRGHRSEDGAEMQLVEPPHDVTAAIADLDLEGPSERPPIGAPG